MKKVTSTSIESYHSLQSEGTQVLRVAAYCEKETKAGRLVWISKISEHFVLSGQMDLNQKSTVSARFNAIKKNGVMLEGRKYKLELVKEERPGPGKPKVEMYALVLEAPAKAVQTELF
jgi:hypothetical protein